MPVEIPCTSSKRRVTRSVPFMGALEPRTLFSAIPTASSVIASATKTIQADLSTVQKTSGLKVVKIGPHETIKDINSAKWPGKSDAPVEFVLDPGTYSVKQHNVTGKLTIVSADPKHPATLKLADTFVQRKGKVLANNPSINVSGTLTIKNVNTSGTDNAVLLGSSTSGNIDCENVNMSAGAVWRGSGGNYLYFKNNSTKGSPRANVYSSYDHTVKVCVIDHSGTSAVIPQGGHFEGGNPVGEAAIRIMDVNSLTLIGVKTKPWFYKPGKEWKQDVQIRPDSKTVQVVNCTFYQADVGDMVWRVPAHTIDSVLFLNCTMTKSVSVQAGVKLLNIINCSVGGRSSANKSIA